MSKFRITPARVLKWMIALGFMVVLVWITNNFISQMRMRKNVSERAEDLSQQKVETTEKVKHYESEEGIASSSAEADRHFVGDDGLYHLQGNVKVVLPKKAEGEDVNISAEEILHDPETNYVQVKGRSQIKIKDLTVDSEFMEYTPEKETFQTNRGLSFSSERISGSAQWVRYRLKMQRLNMSQDVNLRLDPEHESGEAISIQGDELDYWHKRTKGTLTGNTMLCFGESWVTADSVAFELSRDKNYVKALDFKGSVVAHLVTEETLDLRTDELSLKTFLRSNDIRSLKSQGNSFFSLLAEDKDTLQVESGSMDMSMSRGGELKNFQAVQQVKMFEVREGEERKVEGDLIDSQDRGKSLQVKGGEDRQARIRTQKYEISADDLSVLLESKNLDAKGGVRVILKSGTGSDAGVGFFSAESPVFIDADEMRYRDETKRFLFKGSVKVWQGKDMLETPELSLSRTTGRLSCQQRVRTRLTLKPDQDEDAAAETEEEAEAEAKQVDITARSLEFDPEKRRITYRDRVVLRVEDIKLEADTLFMDLDQAAGELKTVTALQNVRIERGETQGQGQEAVYNIAQEVVVLSGKPVLIDKTRGKVEGHKLTFHLADDRIIVENKDRERSETVIK
jgi:lipopolysaccharide transport protein LptA